MSDSREPQTPIDPDTGLPADAALPDAVDTDPDLRTDAEAEAVEESTEGQS
jgi:hypothetical protein